MSDHVEGFAMLPTWMIRDESISGGALLVYMVLASRAGYRANFPGQETIAEESRLTSRSVRTKLKELEALGLVERVHRPGKGGGRQTDTYILLSSPRMQPEIDYGSDGGQPEMKQGATGNDFRFVPYIEIDKEEIDKDVNGHSTKSLFEQAWTHWPKKQAKKTAEAKFVLKARTVGAEKLSQLVIRFGDAYRESTDLKFVPHLTTWLNQERWTDPVPRVERQLTNAERALLEMRGGGDRAALGC